MRKQKDHKNGKTAWKRIIAEIFVVTLIAVSLVSCKKSDLEQEEPKKTVDEEEKDGEYVITIKDTGYIEDVPWENEFSFDYIQVERMADSFVEENANREIEKAATSWIKGVYSSASEVYLDIYDHSDRYLSMGNRFAYTSFERRDFVCSYITIDMKSGKRVMLNDLVEINTAFAEHIQNNNLAKESERAEVMEFDSVEENLWEYLKEFTPDELLDVLEECSKTQEQAIEDNKIYENGYENIGPLMYRSSFYLRSGKLVIVIGNAQGGVHITFELDDIRDFLKVEPWS